MRLARLRTLVYSAFTLLALQLSCPPKAQADVATAIGGAGIASFTGKQVLDEADRFIAQEIDRTKNAASGLINQALTGLSAIVQGAHISLSAIESKTIADMSDQERQIFINIKETIDEIQKSEDAAYNIEETSNIDIAARLGNIPFVNEAVFISSIRGLSILRGNSQYPVAIYATGLGPGTADRRASLSFKIDNQEIKPILIDLSSHNRGVYTFSAAQLEKYFLTDSPVILNMTATLTVEDKGWLFWRKREVVTPIYLTLYPELAGQMIIDADVPRYGWVKVSDGSKQIVTSDCGNGQCDKREGGSSDPVPGGNFEVPGNRKISNVTYSCGYPAWDLAGCSYSYPDPVLINDEQTKATLNWRQTGVWVTYTLKYDILEYRAIAPTDTTTKLPLYFGKPIDFCVESGGAPSPGAATISAFYKVHIDTITKQKLDFVKGQSAKPFIDFVGEYDCPPNKRKVVYQIYRPH